MKKSKVLEQVKKQRINVDLSDDAAKELNVIAAKAGTVRKLYIEKMLEDLTAQSIKRGTRKS